MRRALPLLVLPLLALAACGDDDDTAASSSTGETSATVDASSTSVGELSDSVPDATDDSLAEGAPTEDTTATQDSMPVDTTGQSLPEETAACANAADDAVTAVSTALDEVAGMTADEAAGSDVTVTMQDDIDAAMAAAVDAGCDQAGVDTLVCDGLAALSPEGEAAEAVLDGVSADCA
ncbi:MAG: hypothetical protein S0880_12775 [Actinomycetota bacterium]|nr:hypothetical protein [Actinomycetota bacterium]